MHKATLILLILTSLTACEKNIKSVQEDIPEQQVILGGDDENDPGIPALTANLCGQSLGGILREGPSRDFKKLASLLNGSSLTILERSGERMNDYSWFRVRTENGLEGYQWGGILCSCLPTYGAYQTCP